MRLLRLVGVLEWSFKTRLYMCRDGKCRRLKVRRLSNTQMRVGTQAELRKAEV